MPQTKLNSYGDSLICPLCGRHKKADFELCYQCHRELQESKKEPQEEEWDCKYRYDGKCIKDNKYCGDMMQFGFDCYERNETIKEDKNGI